MKFSNGCWLQKEGCACFSPAEVYFTKIEKDKVVLCAPTHKINHRGDTLGGINLTVEITTPMPEVIRVKTYHYKGAIQDGPQFALNLPKQTAIDATEDDEKIVVKSGNAKLVITKENWSMTYYNGDKKLSTSAWRDLAYMKTDWKGDAYVKSADKDAYMRQQLSLGVGELIYGLGERFAAFTRNGQSIDIWNEDGGTSTDQSYKNIPFYISNKGYGVFVNHTEKVSFEVATEAVTKVEFSVPGESLDYFFFNGPDLKDVLRRYTDLTGKPAAWISGKDIILHIIGMIGVDGALYKSMEFVGDGIRYLTMGDRFTIANMAIEAGGKNGIFPVDDLAKQYMEEHSKRPYVVYEADEDAEYDAEYTIDLSTLKPTVSFPHLPENTRTIDEVGDVKIDQVVIGSCTNGRMDDLRIAASVLKGKKVKKGLRVIVIPATQKIYLQAMEEGLLRTFIEAGAVVSTPTCGPCLGGYMGILAAGERCVSTTNRNFVGRMGHVDSEVYLASPAVAAASAVTGKISSPEEVM